MVQHELDGVRRIERGEDAKIVSEVQYRPPPCDEPDKRYRPEPVRNAAVPWALHKEKADDDRNGHRQDDVFVAV